MSNFERAMKVLAVHEGGYSNHKADPGGATMKGVTKRVYDAHRRQQGLDTRDVRQITDAEVYEIYRRQYWMAARCNDLPIGLAYCVFDAAVNSGVSQAVKWMQRSVGVTADGIVGAMTLAAVGRFEVTAVIDEMCDRRLSFMKRLKNWPSFKNGWARRVAEVRAQSKAWANGSTPAPSIVVAPAEAAGPESLQATITDAIKNPAAIGAVGSTVGSVAAVANGEGPFQYALAAVLVMATAVAAWWLVKRRK
jgi:lysozyme family protein